MRWKTEARVAAGLIVLLSACAATPSETPAATLIASPTPAASTDHLPEPGQPFDASAVLAAMRDSTRPDGVPNELQTDAITGAIARAIWTFDGRAWNRLIVSATCGTTCSIEVSGTHGDAVGEDVWVFSVDPASGSVGVDSAELRALPPDVVSWIDQVARSVGSPVLDGMRLTTTAWLPPPDGDRFRLSYRSGGEEGSCAVEMLIDVRSETVVDERASGC